MDELPICDFCMLHVREEDEFACDRCQPKLKVLMEATIVLDPISPAHADLSPSIGLKNVKLSSDYPGEAIVAIDGSGALGVQKPFKFDGQGKCIVCAELTTNALVCTECTDAIYLARNMKNASSSGSTDEFIALFQDEGFIALMKFVASNSVRKYMEAEIEQFRKS